jgi:hypothetical protein
MATVTTRQKNFELTEEQFKMLKVDRKLHLSGKSKSYTREEAHQIIKGHRKL